MPAPLPDVGVASVRLARDASALAGLSAADLRIEPVLGPGPLFDAAYDALRGEFGDDVLDTRERYLEAFEAERVGDVPFPFRMFVSTIQVGDGLDAVGVLAGNIMPVAPTGDPPPAGTPTVAFFAIGHQVTAPAARAAGVRGCGRRLWEESVARARSLAAARSWDLHWSVVESQVSSIGYCSSAGYRWPKGLYYWQPPLDFRPDGDFVHAEVPEHFMVCRHGPGDVGSIDRGLLLDIIATLYRVWSLGGCRARLGPEAFTRAESYVMGEVFGRIRTRLPALDPVPLITPPLQGPPGGAPRRVRTLALNRGVQHGLVPIPAPRLAALPDTDSLLGAMSGAVGPARAMGRAADVLETMWRDPDCRVVLTLTASATRARLDGLLAGLVDAGRVGCIVATADAAWQAANAERGAPQFRLDGVPDDARLYEQGYNRAGDALFTQDALDEFAALVGEILDAWATPVPLTPSGLLRAIGRAVGSEGGQAGLLGAAARRGVPVYAPSPAEGEFGLALALHARTRRAAGRAPLALDVLGDLEAYLAWCEGAGTMGLLSVGGGPPLGWALQAGPWSDAVDRRERGVTRAAGRFRYAVRVGASPAGESPGGALAEAVSWGQVLPADEGGLKAEVDVDPALALPVLLGGVCGRRVGREGRA